MIENEYTKLLVGWLRRRRISNWIYLTLFILKYLMTVKEFLTLTNNKSIRLTSQNLGAHWVSKKYEIVPPGNVNTTMVTLGRSLYYLLLTYNCLKIILNNHKEFDVNKHVQCIEPGTF